MFKGIIGTSWKTSVAGILTAIGTLITFVAVPLVDNDPATAPQWMLALTGVATALGIYIARDDDKTSEDVAKDYEKKPE